MTSPPICTATYALVRLILAEEPTLAVDHPRIYRWECRCSVFVPRRGACYWLPCNDHLVPAGAVALEADLPV